MLVFDDRMTPERRGVQLRTRGRCVFELDVQGCAVGAALIGFPAGDDVATWSIGVVAR